MKIFETVTQIIEHALMEYEEHPDKFFTKFQFHNRR